MSSKPECGISPKDKMTRYTRSDLLAKREKRSDDKVLIDLGCGTRKREGYLGMDRVNLPGVDIVYEVESSIPLEDNTVDGIWSNFFFEHVSNLVRLLQEIYRISRPGALIEFTVPYYQSVTQFKDPTHHAVITPETMRYFTDEKWYGSDYGFGVNFKILDVQYTYLPPFDRMMSPKLIILRPFIYPIVLFSRKYLWNVVHSIKITACVEK
jgi:SAM-dependent methyltransferase